MIGIDKAKDKNPRSVHDFVNGFAGVGYNFQKGAEPGFAMNAEIRFDLPLPKNFFVGPTYSMLGSGTTERFQWGGSLGWYHPSNIAGARVGVSYGSYHMFNEPDQKKHLTASIKADLAFFEIMKGCKHDRHGVLTVYLSPEVLWTEHRPTVFGLALGCAF